MKTAFTFLFLLQAMSAIYSQPGTLDKSFNDSGKVHIPNYITCFAMALQTDKKILVAGGIGDDAMYAIARFTDGGFIDSSFGTNGKTELNNINGTATAISILPDNKIITTGGVVDSKVITVKLKEDGAPDSLFGINGISIIDMGGFIVKYALAVQDDGKIVIAGAISYNLELGFNMLLLRLNANGSLDKGFGSNGYIIDKKGYELTAVKIQADGKIVTAGHQWRIGAGFRDQFVITRYNIDGSFDDGFGADGHAYTDVTDGNDVPYSLAILDDNKIVVAGEVNYGFSGHIPSYMAAVQYNTDGSLDNSFGENGIAKIIFNDTSSQASNLQVQADGKLILTGRAYNSLQDGTTASGFALCRLKANGTIDSSFANNGREVTSFGGKYAAANASVLQPDGKIVLGGDGYPTDTAYELLLARYNSSGGTPIAKKIQKILKWWRNHNNSITLNWQSTELNSRGHSVVQRAAAYNTIQNTGAWVNIGRVGSAGITQSFTDINPLPGTNYYRVQQVNPSGNIETTNVVAVTINESLAISISPNPAQDVLYLKGLDASATYSLQVSNRQGNILVKAMVKQSSLYKLNVELLPKGVYYLKLVSGIHTTDLKFVKEQ